MYSEDISVGSWPLPMMTSVEPPPMSMTARLLGEGQGMDHAREDQAGFFAAGDDFDGEAQRGFGARQEIAGVAGDAEGVRGHRAHAVGVEAAQAFAEAFQHRDGAFDGLVAKALFGVQSGGQPDGFLRRSI